MTAVIAYVGKTVDEVLKLRGGDTLVCDASPEAVRVGSTDASVLKRYYNDDVQVLSVPGLHAGTDPRDAISVGWFGQRVGALT